MIARVVGVGAGGHAKAVIDALRSIGDHEIVALVDQDEDLHGRRVLGVPVEGGDDILRAGKGLSVDRGFVGIGSVGDPTARREAFALLNDLGLDPVDAVHAAAVVSPAADLGSGPIVLANATVNPAAQLGDNVIVNTGATVEHDCRVGDHSHVAPGATVGGSVEIGAQAHVGLGASVREGVEIGEGAMVAAGAVVVDDVEQAATVAGVPAKPMEEVHLDER